MNYYLKKINTILVKYKVDHILFWFIYTLLYTFFLKPGSSYFGAFINSIIILSFHAAVCYFNIYYLIPEYLFKRRHLIYILGMVLSILVAIFPLSVIFHRYFSLDEDTKRDIWTVYFFMFNYLSIQFSFAITTVFKLLKSWYNREQKHRELEKVTVETELKFLKSQINPHFLFNTLNSLYALTLKNSEQSPDVVLKLSNILRYVLYEGAKQKRVPLSKEIDYLKSYLELEKMRLGERVDVQFDIYGDFEDKFIEPMLFVSFVENSFKHGAGGNVKGAWVKVSARVDDESKFHLNVSNSKSKAKINKDKTYQGGIGLTNTKKRLELLYPKSHTLKVEELEDKFNVNLEIQLR